MLIYGRASEPTTIHEGRRITSIQGSLPKTRARIAVTFATGGVIHWDDHLDDRMQPFGDDMPWPLVCFNRGGYLIAAGDDVCEVYATAGRVLQLEAVVARPLSRPLAVLPGPRTNEFGIVTAEGEVSLYQFG